MTKSDVRVNAKVRQLCRDINKEADPARLQSLAIRLQAALQAERYDTRVTHAAPERGSDSPFDKIMWS